MKEPIFRNSFLEIADVAGGARELLFFLAEAAGAQGSFGQSFQLHGEVFDFGKMLIVPKAERSDVGGRRVVVRVDGVETVFAAESLV